MATHEHLASLREKHLLLDDRISREAVRPLPDQTKISRLKREKLKLKDQIARLEGGPMLERALH